MEEKTEKNTSKEKEKSTFNLKTDIQRIYSAFKRIDENKIKNNYSVWEDNVFYFVFIKNSFYEQLESNLLKVPMAERISLVGNLLLRRRVLVDVVNKKKAVVIREGEVESSIWNYVEQFTAVCILNHNGNKNINDEMYVDFGQAHGFFSMGNNTGCLNIYNLEDPAIMELLDKDSPHPGYILHDCDYLACAYGNDNTMDSLEHVNNTDNKMLKKIAVEIGKEKKCKYCGETFYFDGIDPEYLFKQYRIKAMGHKR